MLAAVTNPYVLTLFGLILAALTALNVRLLFIAPNTIGWVLSLLVTMVCLASAAFMFYLAFQSFILSSP